MIEYTINNEKYALSYQELKAEYERFCAMDNEDFKNNIPAAIHLACVICWLKEIPSDACLCDNGIIHELVHVFHIPNGTTTSLKDIRSLFKLILKLS